MKKQYLIEVTWFDIFTKKTNTRTFYEQCKPIEINACVAKKVEWYKGLSGTKNVTATCKEIVKTKEIKLKE